MHLRFVSVNYFLQVPMMVRSNPSEIRLFLRWVFFNPIIHRRLVCECEVVIWGCELRNHSLILFPLVWEDFSELLCRGGKIRVKYKVKNDEETIQCWISVRWRCTVLWKRASTLIHGKRVYFILLIHVLSLANFEIHTKWIHKLNCLKWK